MWREDLGELIDPADDAPKMFTGSTALVTGGSHGIGATISRSLAKQGAAVAVGYRRDKARAQQILAEIRSEGTGGSIHRGNVGDGDDCRRVIAEVVAHHGSLDILVNTAAITVHKPFSAVTDSDWEKVLAVNVRGVSSLCQAALDHMTEQGTGRIINVSSVPGMAKNADQATYAASISSLAGLTKALAKEAACRLQESGKLQNNPIGITVNTVTGGVVETEMIGAPQDVINQLIVQIPVRRFARPEEIAQLVCFLASDASGYITGQAWSVNGGLDT
jgi:acetoacetyl-CoA reductase/3-oxoacyl-[acyl-carrier protein] reductase